MKILVKILTSFAIIGFLMVIIAAALDNYNKPIADMFGYFGVMLFTIEVSIIAFVVILAIWNKKFKNYVLSADLY